MASWTATSPISGSKWDGPSGCPIVSPSNWQTQVLDNLTVLAGHDHSGSAGEGIAITVASLFPTVDSEVRSALFPSASSSGWAIELETGKNTFGFIRVSTCTVGASITYPIYVRDGTYELSIEGGANSNARVTIYIDSDIVVADHTWLGATTCVLYSSSTYGEKVLKFIMSGSNAANPKVSFSGFGIFRQ